MSLRIRLLGRPCAAGDGQAVRGPRGRKAWAVLAVLLLAERPMSRRSLANLLFPDADDPLGALRWTLSELRRGLGGEVSAGGDPVRVTVDPRCRIDLAELLNGQDDVDLGPPEELLDGADGAGGVDFDLWLTAARHRVTTVRAARLRRVAEVALAGRDPALAVTAAATALAAESHQPAARATLVNALLAEGDHAAALAQLREWGAWIRKEARVSQVVRGRSQPASRRRPGSTSRFNAVSRIEAGQAAIAAGAVTVGLDHLREAVRLAAQQDDERLQATALRARGDALVHALADQCRHDQALPVLRRSAELAGGLGLVAFARGDLPEAMRWLDEAGRRARADHDRYTWLHAWVQDALCQVTVAGGLARAAGDVRRLRHIAAAARLPDFTVRADLHDAAIGVPAAAARAAAAATR